MYSGGTASHDDRSVAWKASTRSSELVSVAVPAGARLRLQVTSSCYPDLYPNPNTGHDLAEGPPSRVEIAAQTIAVGGPEGSALELPVLGDLR
jgi:predicted acyl esterase